MPAATAAKTAPCLYCGRFFTPKGVSEHERHACKKSPHRRKRSFGKKKCKYCGKLYHAAGLRAHVATQHSIEFAREKTRRKPSSRAAQRRELAAKLSPPAAKREAPRHHSPTTTHLKSPGKAPREHAKHHHTGSNEATHRAWSRMETKMSQAAAK